MVRNYETSEGPVMTDRIDFFIAGSERSGTTVTGALLDKQPEVCGLQGTTVMTRLEHLYGLVCRVIRQGGEFEGVDPANCDSLLEFVKHQPVTPFLHTCYYNITFYENLMNSSLSDVTKDVFAHQAYLKGFRFDRYMARFDPANPSWANTVAAMFSEFVESTESRGRIYGEQTPDNALHLKVIQRMYPDVKFIFMVRHPVTGVASLCDRYRQVSDAVNQYRKPFVHFPFNDPEIVGRTLFVKFEDILNHREVTLQSMGDHLGFTPTEIEGEHNSKVFSQYVGKSLEWDRYFRSAVKYNEVERTAIYEKNKDIADLFYSADETAAIIGYQAEAAA